jgi:hypothetical protein
MWICDERWMSYYSTSSFPNKWYSGIWYLKINSNSSIKTLELRKIVAFMRIAYTVVANWVVYRNYTGRCISAPKHEFCGLSFHSVKWPHASFVKVFYVKGKMMLFVTQLFFRHAFNERSYPENFWHQFRYTLFMIYLLFCE